MKVLIINRKKLGLITIIIGLMAVLFGFGRYFDDRIKYAALFQRNITSLKTYKAINGNFVYKLPGDWTTSEKKTDNNEQLYHNDFQSNDGIIHGSAEVWNTKNDLKQFIERNKKSFDKNDNCTGYDAKYIKLNSHEGYYVTYRISREKGIAFDNYEYFIEDKGSIILFSFSVRDENFKENMIAVFKIIAETFKYDV